MFIFQGKVRRFRRKKFLSGVRPVAISLTVTQGVGFMQKLGRQIEMIVFICLAVFVVSLGLAILGFANPETISTPADVQLVNVGFFSYSSGGTQGLYDSDGPQTGDPVFLKATCNVKVQFNYSLNGDPLSDVEGTISFKAETIASNGWKRTFPLLASAQFSGSTTRIQANLNPCEIIQTLRTAEKAVQVRNPSYQLTLTPEVKVSATAGLVPMQSTFAPRLTFYLDDRQMYVLRENPDDDALSSFKVESKVATASVPNKIPLPGFMLDVRLARTLALMGLITSLGLGLFLGWSIYSATRQDPLLAASLRYGSLMVHLTQLPAPLAERELWVNSLDDLALLAERNATAILHLTGETADDFFVEGNNVVYRVQISRRREK
jgi:hypothetical protein